MILFFIFFGFMESFIIIIFFNKI